jgi:hypothetical protein
MNSSFRLSRRRVFLSVAASVVLAACAGPQVSSSGPPPASSGEGVAIVSVTHNEEAGRQASVIFYVDQGDFAKRRLLRSMETTLSIPLPSDFSDDYGHVYALVLPAGRHEISGWMVTNNTVNLSPRVAPKPLSFTVQAGQTIYLGNLNMNILMGRNVLGVPVPVDAIAEVRARSAVDLPLAQRKNPSLAGKIVPALLPVGRWEGSDALPMGTKPTQGQE